MLALDADLNPMLGVSLGVGAEQTELACSARQAVATGDAEHEPTLEGIVERFGADAPDGVRLVVATRLEAIDPGCMCCGVNPANLVRELEHGERTVVCDLEAGLGTVERLEAGHADVLLVVANPTAEGARRRAPRDRARRRRRRDHGRRQPRPRRVRHRAHARGRSAIASSSSSPRTPVIAAADRDGIAPIDLDPDAPGVAALVRLAERLAGAPVAA